MLVPGIFGMNSLFDDFDDAFEFKPAGRKQTTAVKNISTDVKEFDNGYRIEMELPGFAKEDVKAQVKDGYLTIQAEHQEKKEENKEGKYIRKERFFGKCQRSFYVGKQIEQQDVKAKFENGILELFVPKKVAKPEVAEEKYISIE